MTFTRHYASPHLAAWYRVFLYAVDHHGEQLERGQLRRAVDPQKLTRPAEISRAINHGIRKKMLRPGSSSSMLLVVDEDESADEDAA